MISPSSGVRPLRISQNSRFVATPTPSAAWHFISGTSVVGGTGGAGLLVGGAGLLVCGAGLLVCGAGFLVVVCASSITDAHASTAAPAAMPTRDRSSRFSVLTSRFVCRFGSRFEVRCSMFDVEGPRRRSRSELRTSNPEPRTPNAVSTLNTNRERRTAKRERYRAGLVIAHARVAGRNAVAQAGNGASQLDQLEKLHARPCVRSERAEHRARHREGILLLDAAHRHAQVGRLDDHGDADRRNLLADRIGDLVREPLLNLQPAAEHVDQPWNLAQPDDAGTRNVGDVALSEKRQQMVLAQAIEVDVLDDDHLAIIDGEQG